jgi:hypothetical protein
VGGGPGGGFFAAELLYGQVKKRYRQRRLVGVSYLVRCSPRAALQAALTRLGLSGKLNTAFVERLKKNRAAERGRADPPQLGKQAGQAAAARRSGMVARVLSLRIGAPQAQLLQSESKNPHVSVLRFPWETDPPQDSV